MAPVHVAGRSGTFREYFSHMKNRPHDPQQQPPTDGPLARLVDDEESGANPAAQSLPQPPEAGHGRDDYAAGTPEHDDDREL